MLHDKIKNIRDAYKKLGSDIADTDLFKNFSSITKKFKFKKIDFELKQHAKKKILDEMVNDLADLDSEHSKYFRETLNSIKLDNKKLNNEISLNIHKMFQKIVDDILEENPRLLREELGRKKRSLVLAEDVIDKMRARLRKELPKELTTYLLCLIFFLKNKNLLEIPNNKNKQPDLNEIPSQEDLRAQVPTTEEEYPSLDEDIISDYITNFTAYLEADKLTEVMSVNDPSAFSRTIEMSWYDAKAVAQILEGMGGLTFGDQMMEWLGGAINVRQGTQHVPILYVPAGVALPLGLFIPGITGSKKKRLKTTR